AYFVLFILVTVFLLYFCLQLPPSSEIYTLSLHDALPISRSFANALRGALREDPDILLVGELRDLETIELALTAAATGNLVFGTRSEEHTSELQSPYDLVCRLLLEKKKKKRTPPRRWPRLT